MGLTQVDGGDGLKKPIDLADNEKARFGTGNDLEIYHNGSTSLIDNVGAGSLAIRQLTNDADVVLQSDNGSGGVTTYLRCDGSSGATRLYNYGSEKLTTFSSGVDISGELQCDSLDVDGGADISGATNFHANVKLQDNDTLVLGAGNDLQIFHDGTDNRIVTDGPNIRIGTSGEEFAKFNNNGAVDLYYDNSRKFSTASDGVTVVGNLGLGDGGVIECGQGGDLRIQHSGSNSFVETSTNSSGDLYVISQGTNHDLYLQANDDIFIRPANGEAGIVVNGNGAVELYYDGQMRFETNASAVTMRGGGYHRCEGHFRPWSNNTYDLGTSGDRWRNVYTNDLHLSNEGSANDVDGTWGNYTIQEGEDDLFLINRRNGKKYKFNLTEVN